MPQIPLLLKRNLPPSSTTCYKYLQMKKTTDRTIHFLKIALLIVSLITIRVLLSNPTSTQQLTFLPQDITIDIEIANSPEEHAQGLMQRKSLPENSGMLFVFEEPHTLSFWMKDTYIPLDIIFIDENLNIINITKNTTPLFEGTYSSEAPAKYVVEVNAGFSEQHNIVPGNPIKSSAL